MRAARPAGDEALAEALLRVQHEAYAAEAELIGDDRVPALHEDLSALCAAPSRWFAVTDGPEVLAAVGWVQGVTHVDIDRLVVAGHARRRGLGTSLVRAVVREGRLLGPATHPCHLVGRVPDCPSDE